MPFSYGKEHDSIITQQTRPLEITVVAQIGCKNNKFPYIRDCNSGILFIRYRITDSERHARPQKGGFLWMKTRKIARRPQNGGFLWMKTRKMARRPQNGGFLWMKTEKIARRPQKGGFLWMKTRKMARRPQKGLILWTNLRHCRGNCNVACICT